MTNDETQLIADLKTQIIETLEIEDLTADEIETDAPLFRDGLGLDSIDALELVVMVEKYHGIKLKQMAVAKAAFESVRTLAQFVRTNSPA